MAFPGTGKIWMNGKFVDWKDANIPPKGSACFRLEPHMRRLIESAKIYRMEYPLDLAGWMDVVLETIRVNEMKSCYIRPLVYRGYKELGVNPLGIPVDAAVMVWDWGAYLGAGAIEEGADVKVSSWNRMAPNTLPAMAKTTANYANSQLIKMEALADGYSEAIALDVNGAISEGSGQNIFVVRDGQLYTPPLGSSILGGITRDSIITLAREAGYTVTEAILPRESLYVADEVFFVGTASEVTPVRSVDRIKVGAGKPGPITLALRRAFFQVINGEVPDRHGWLTYVYPAEASVRATPKVVAGRSR
jgi:branched-chain amino acid aminotransferase